jgi:hypothetical protein
MFRRFQDITVSERHLACLATPIASGNGTAPSAPSAKHLLGNAEARADLPDAQRSETGSLPGRAEVSAVPTAYRTESLRCPIDASSFDHSQTSRWSRWYASFYDASGVHAMFLSNQGGGLYSLGIREQFDCRPISTPSQP